MKFLEEHIYLDNMATTRPDPLVIDAMLPFFDLKYGNPGSDNYLGKLSKTEITRSKKVIQKILNAKKSEIIFSSCVTESITSIFSSLIKNSEYNHIITQITEHKTVIENCKALEKKGWKVTYLDVDEYGVVDVKELENSILPETKLISIMQVNNEVGTIQPINEIGKIARENDILFMVDGSQGLGKDKSIIDFSLIDFYTISSHKIYAPKGISALVCSLNGVSELSPLLIGGNQEDGFRSGTPNVPGIVGLTKAVALLEENTLEIDRIYSLKTKFLKLLNQNNIDYELNSPIEKSVPHCINIWFKGVDNKELKNSLYEQLSFSVTSACNSTLESYVLKSISKNDFQISESIRIGIGRFTTENDIDVAVKHIIEAINKIKIYNIHVNY